MALKIYRQLQALRAVACSFVVVDHSLAAAWHEQGSLKVVAWCFGDIGVSVFFVISGFIMVHVSGTRHGVAASGRFLLRRLQRIVPLYWAATGLQAAKLLSSHATSMTALMPKVVLSLFFIPFQDRQHVYRPVLGVGWTLNYEMAFYVLFSACLLIPGRFASTGVACLAIAALIVGHYASTGVIAADLPGGVFDYLSYPIIGLFAVGMLIRTALPLLPTTVSLRYSALAMSTIGLAIVLIFAVAIEDYPISFGWRLLIWLGSSAMVFGSILFEGPYRRDPALAAMQYLGDASFSTYLFHPIAIYAVYAFARVVPLTPVVAFSTMFVAAHVAGVLVHEAVEKPMLAGFVRARRQRARPT